MTPSQEAALTRMSPLLASAGPVFAGQLRDALSTGKAQLWPSGRACVLTEVTDFAPEPRRVLHAWLLGDQGEAEALMPGVLAWAEVVGCTEREVRHTALPQPDGPQVRLLTPDLAALAWPAVEAWIAAALETTYTPVTLQDVRRDAANDSMQLWAISEGAEPVAVAVTMLRETATGLHLSLGPIGGSGAERWAGVLDEALTNFARTAGCVGLISEGGRRGWGRIARHLGWREGSTVYGKDLTEEGAR